MNRERIRRRIVIHGHVQGVFFRDAIRQRAEAEQVAGLARNRSDGAVEVVLEGPRPGVERLIEFLHSGPPRARVEHVEVREETPEGLSGFETR